MASWKICTALLLSVLIVLVIQCEGNRRRAGRRQDLDNSGRGGAAGGGRRRGGNGRRRGQPDTDVVDDNGANAMGGGAPDGADIDHSGGGRGGRGRGGRRGGGRRPNGGRRGGGRGRGRPGGRPPGGRGGSSRQAKIERLMGGFSRSLNDFSMKVYREMASIHQDNFVFSPYSVFSAMSMVLLGSAGRTKRQLITGLSIRTPVHFALRAYNDTLASDEENNPMLAIANGMWVRQGFNPNPRYVNRLRTFYDSQVSELEENDPEDAINQWVEDKTMGEIVDFLPEGAISSDTVIMLVNAIYFKGMWKDQFDASMTRDMPFQVSESNSVTVPMMRREGQYKFQMSNVLGASVLELPYEGDRFSFFIILPEQGSELSVIESRITPQNLNETLSTPLEPMRMDVEIPKFSLDTDQSMKSLMQAIGINHLFDPNLCKLKKMTSSRNVYVSEVSHRAVLELDEEGTVAAAATGVQISLVSLPPQFKANRPFMFVLRDKLRSVNLFVGRYVNPNGENLEM